MDDELKKTLNRNFIYHTAPTCPFCGGAMLPLTYVADENGPWTDRVYQFEDRKGVLKTCDGCGIVKFYPDEEV